LINKYSNEPLYCQLKSIIIGKIEDGDYPEDTKIPSELDLCKQYNISRPTVRQAITELTYNGYLYRVRGKGTFVAKTKKRVDIKDYSGFTPSILDSQSPENRIINNTRIIKDSVFEKLRTIFNIPVSQYNKLEFAEAIYQTKNGNDIYSVNTSYIPLNLFPDIINSILSGHASHEVLKGKYPLVPAKSKSTLEIIYSNQEDTRYLEIQTGQPLIKIENVLFSKSGQVVEYIITKYKADKCRLIFENIK
jgi:DNA-binding GntR family transcriptional regulator